MQPVSMPTRRRTVPTAGVRSGTGWALPTSGSSRSMAAMPAGRPQSTLAPGARVAALDLLAGRLDQLVVLDARGARGHAGHATEAAVEMPRHLLVERLALQADVHKIDAPPRRVHLLAPQQVGRAGRQAEPAMDAVIDELLVRRVVLVEGAGPVQALPRCDVHARSLPRTGPGSSCRRDRTAP